MLDFEIRFLLEDLANLGLGTVYERKRRLKAFEAAWATEQDRQPGWPTNPVDQQFHTHLLNWLRFHKAMLIGELIPISLSYLIGNPLSPFRTAYDHVLIDEYQDLNPAEQSIVDLFSSGGTLTVIGDPDQSIYEHLRFAHPEGIITFPERHVGTHDVPILECRRCPPVVVEMATALIRNNQNRLAEINLQTFAGKGSGEVAIVQWQTMEDEANGIAAYLTEKIRNGVFNPGRTLVLSPRRQLAYLIRDALQVANIPAHSFFSEELLDGNPRDRAELSAQEGYTLLNLLADPTDLVSLRCWLGFGHNDLARRQYARLRTYCMENNATPMQILDAILNREIDLRHIDYIVARYQVLRERLQHLRDLDAQEVVDLVFPENEDWTGKFRQIIEDEVDQEEMTVARILQALKIIFLSRNFLQT